MNCPGEELPSGQDKGASIACHLTSPGDIIMNNIPSV